MSLQISDSLIPYKSAESVWHHCHVHVTQVKLGMVKVSKALDVLIPP